MNIFVNQESKKIDDSPLYVDTLLNILQPKSPFAISLNSQFIAKSNYASTLIHENDHIDIIAPITGG